MHKFTGLIIFLLLSTLWCFGKISLPGIFSNNMVLQQQSQAAIWGKSSPGSGVSVFTSWDKQIHAVKANNNGQWKLNIATPVAGGPFEISISDGEKITLKNILIGEVWICSGKFRYHAGAT